MSDPNYKQNNIIDYDAIFVGQLGAVVCNIILNSMQVISNYLIINECKEINEPSLLPVQSPLVKINQDFIKKCDLESRKIQRIVPDHNLVIMKSKKCFRYKYLLYTAPIEEWSDFEMITNLHQALLTKYSFVFSNVVKNQPQLSRAQQIFERFKSDKNVERRRVSMNANSKSKIRQEGNDSLNADTQRVVCSESSINILFYLPSPPHAGYDNINILYKFDEFMEHYSKILKQIQNCHQSIDSENNSDEQLPLNFILLMEGDSITPNCPMIDTCIKQKIEEKGIKILRRHKIERIDYLRRKISVWAEVKNEEMEDEEECRTVSIQIKDKILFSFDYLYVVLKQKTPQLLARSGINPYQNCQRTLQNSQHPNIFVLGADIFPTTHSFEAVNNQAHVAAANIAKLVKGLKKNTGNSLSDYSGHSQFFLWVSQNSYITFYHQYERDRQKEMRSTKLKLKKTIKGKSKGFMKQTSDCWLCFWQGIKCRIQHRLQVGFYYNFKSYGSPFYFFVPEHQISSD